MSQSVLVERQGFDREVFELLCRTSFGCRHKVKHVEDCESWEDRLKRAKLHSDCGKWETGSRCEKCSFERFSFRVDCHLRGCRSCWRRLKYRLVSKYAEYLIGLERKRIRFVTLSYRWSLTEVAGRSVDFLMKCADLWRRKFRFDGAIMSSEMVEKVGGFWYVHIHGIVVGTSFNYGSMGDYWAKLTGSRNVEFDEVRSVSGLLWYILKYVSKDWLVGSSSAVEYVNLLKVLYRKKLIRTFGCLRGVGKESRKNPRWVQLLLGGGEGSEAGELMYSPVGFSTNSSCPRCGGERWVWFSRLLTANVNNNIGDRGG